MAGWRSIGVLVAALLSACSTVGRTGTLQVAPRQTLRVAGIGSCDAGEPERTELSSGNLAVLVHGNQPAPGQLQTLARRLRERGLESVCFRWNAKGRITSASEALAAALAELVPVAESITVVGHSLGGLVARRALAEPHGHLGSRVRLVTVATPFAGVSSARTCGKTWLRVLSFGTVAAVCRRLSRGAGWRDFHPTSEFITEPPPLGPAVDAHVHVITDERGACRRRGEDGECAQDDHVFDPDEQGVGYLGPEVVVREIRSGHGAAVAEPSGVLEEAF